MLNKSDLQAIKNLLKDFATKKDLKNELEPIKKDIKLLKESSRFTVKAVVDILDWTQDIHESIVMKKLPERVEKLERTVHIP